MDLIKLDFDVLTYYRLKELQIDERLCITTNSQYIYIYGCFLKWWYPQIIHFNRVFHYFHHPCWGILIFWKPPYSDVIVAGMEFFLEKALLLDSRFSAVLVTFWMDPFLGFQQPRISYLFRFLRGHDLEDIFSFLL